MAPSPHIVLFPFMSKGHTIPILHLARLLLRRGAAVTIFTTPANRPFFFQSLSDTNVTIIDLPFPENIDGVPPGIESTDKLPHISLWVPFARATKLMKPLFEQALESLPPITFMITDGFLGWTLDSANKFGVPRLAYYGMSYFAMIMSTIITSNRFLIEKKGGDDLFPVPDFPWIKLTKNDFDSSFTEPEPNDPQFQFTIEQVEATSKSYGLIVNSFYELETVYSDYWTRYVGSKAWSVGPLCLAADPPALNCRQKKPSWIEWLDRKEEEGKGVLYVAFGSQAEISRQQLEEIKIGLEKSQVNFLWVVRSNEMDPSDGFEERIRDRGMLVREWVNQCEILGHPSVQGFLSHCGWNSVLESICAKVPLLAWPMMAEQPLNARMIEQDIKVGLTVETCDGSVRGFVKWEGVERTVRKLMEGEIGKEVRKKVKEISEAAMKAVEEGGTSWKTLNELIDELMHAKERM